MVIGSFFVFLIYHVKDNVIASIIGAMMLVILCLCILIVFFRRYCLKEHYEIYQAIKEMHNDNNLKTNDCVEPEKINIESIDKQQIQCNNNDNSEII